MGEVGEVSQWLGVPYGGKCSRFGHTEHFAEIHFVNQGYFVYIHAYTMKLVASLIFVV